jgi:hypothetical protein
MLGLFSADRIIIFLTDHSEDTSGDLFVTEANGKPACLSVEQVYTY